tara:strand:- start:933 stop:1304 length:372 start_codon:yes stop_codon:yes gene_type:complete
VYVGIVVLFESSIGYIQPQGEDALLLSDIDDSGEAHDRVLSLFELDGQLYVVVNHWPRQWYRRLLGNPNVTLAYRGVSKNATAVPVIADSELSEMSEAYQPGFLVRLLTGFPPREFVRLDDMP